MKLSDCVLEKKYEYRRVRTDNIMHSSKDMVEIDSTKFRLDIKFNDKSTFIVYFSNNLRYFS